MSFTSISQADIAAGEPNKQSVYQLIKDDLDDLDSRVSTVVASGYVDIFNQIIVLPELKQGMAIWSWDTLSNCQQDGLGSNWVRAGGSGEGTWTDGASASHNVPDARNYFLRMASTYSSVNVADTVADSTAVNGLTVASTNLYKTANALFYNIPFNDNRNYTATTGHTTGDHDHDLSGNSETAPDHIKQELLFKKDITYGEKKLLYRADFPATITNVTLMQPLAGTSTTTLEMDVKVGSITDLRNSTMTSIFSSKPSITSDGSTNYVEDSGTLDNDNVSVSTGEYIELSITGVQTASDSLFVQVTGLY